MHALLIEYSYMVELFAADWTNDLFNVRICHGEQDAVNTSSMPLT
jgi:hypothetical protein